MKNRSIIVLCLAAVTLLAAGSTEIGKDVLMERILEANGGAENREWLHDALVTFHGTISYTDGDQEVIGQWMLHWDEGYKYYYETTFSGYHYATMYDGKTNYQKVFDENGNVSRIGEINSDLFRKTGGALNDRNLYYYNFEKNGVHVEKLPDADVQGVVHHVTKYSFPEVDSFSIKVYWDTDTYLARWIGWGDADLMKVYDYREYHGIPFYFKNESQYQGRTVRTDTDSLLTGEPIDPRVYDPEAKHPSMLKSQQ